MDGDLDGDKDIGVRTRTPEPVLATTALTYGVCKLLAVDGTLERAVKVGAILPSVPRVAPDTDLDSDLDGEREDAGERVRTT